MVHNKKGALGDQAMFVIVAFLIVIITGGIVGGVYMYFGGGYKFKQVDVAVLNYNVERCLVDKGISGFNYDDCGLNKEVITGSYGIRLCEGKDRKKCLDAKPSDIEFNEGSNFQICGLENANENEAFPKCAVRNINIAGKEYILVSVNSQDIRREQT